MKDTGTDLLTSVSAATLAPVMPAASKRERFRITDKHCKFCKEVIVWATNRKDGRRLPLNPEPDVAMGKYLLDDWSMTFIVLDHEMVERAIMRGETNLYVDHRSTCNARERTNFNDPRIVD
jgi:hypothetical protein